MQIIRKSQIQIQETNNAGVKIIHTYPGNIIEQKKKTKKM